ncbi:MAG: hypothetical protein ABH837_01470 [bacterium]
MALRVMYTIFLALLLALFVGLGISAFYQGPREPDYPSVLEESEPCGDETVESKNDTGEIKEIRDNYDQNMQSFQDKIQIYNRNVSIISMILAVIMVILSFIALKNITILNDSLLLGGVLTLCYSVILGIGSGNEQYRFIVVVVAIIIAVILGYKRFVKPDKKKSN